MTGIEDVVMNKRDKTTILEFAMLKTKPSRYQILQSRLVIKSIYISLQNYSTQVYKVRQLGQGELLVLHKILS